MQEEPQSTEIKDEIEVRDESSSELYDIPNLMQSILAISPIRGILPIIAKKKVEAKISEFQNLNCITAETKQKLSHHIARYQTELFDTRKSTRIISRIIFLILLICALIISFSLTFNAVVLTDGIAKPNLNFHVTSSILTNALINLTLYLSSIFFALIISMYSTSYSTIFLASFISSQIDKPLNLWIKMRYTCHIIVDNLISILVVAEKEPEGLMTINYKHKQIIKLEDTAKCIESYLPRRLHTGGTIADDGMKERFMEIAAALRQKEMWILTPMEDTHARFIESLALTLIRFVGGNWDALERIKTEKLTRPPLMTSIVTFVVNVLKAVLLAALPIIGFIIFQKTSLAVTGTTFGTIVTILSIYSVTVVISALDPNLSDRITNIKDIKSFLSNK